MDVYPESWMYTAAAEDAIENAVEMGYECVDCPSCDRGGPWLHKTEASVECPLCGAIITRETALAPGIACQSGMHDDCSGESCGCFCHTKGGDALRE